MFFFVPKDDPHSSRLWRTGSDPVVAAIREKYQKTHGNLRFTSVRANPQPGIDCIYFVSGDANETKDTEALGYLYSFE